MHDGCATRKLARSHICCPTQVEPLHATLLALSILVGCEGPVPATPPPEAAVPVAAVHLDTLEGWLTELHPGTERFGQVLRTTHEGAYGPWAVHTQVFEADHLVLLQTSALISLDDAADDKGIVLLLTQLATQNYALDTGKLQLNPATGEVLLSIELETDDGLGRATFARAMHDLLQITPRVQPLLHQAATAPSP